MDEGRLGFAGIGRWAVGLGCLFALGVPAAANAFPWAAGAPSPVIDGTSLGQTEQQALAALGRPASTSKMNGSDVFGWANGLQVIANAGDGVSIIRLMSPQSGSIDGIQVGATVTAVLAKWGDPDLTGPGVDLYNAGVWTVEVRYGDAGEVTDLLLAWNQTKWPDADLRKGKVYRPN
jgi:hypothetical protein